MTHLTFNRDSLRFFADLLDYPRDGLMQSVRECEALIASRNAQAKVLLGQFRVFAQEASLGQMQEAYTVTFDLNATYHPYVGFHILGETYKRSVFLVELKERYRAQGFAAEGKELPDHLAVLLRFLAACRDEGIAREIISEALLPALEKMLRKGKAATAPSPSTQPANSDCGGCGLGVDGPGPSQVCGEDAPPPDSWVDFQGEGDDNTPNSEEEKEDTRSSPYIDILMALKILLSQDYALDQQEVESHA